MAPMNKMSKLLDKIERRLGTKMLNLPEELSKDSWANEVIANETLDTFSRYFPNEMRVILDRSMRVGKGWYIIDKVVRLNYNIRVLVILRLCWHVFR